MNGITGIFADKDASFAEFVWRAARQTNALSHMREYDFDRPIELPTYHNYDNLSALEAELAMYRGMSLEAAQKEIDEQYESTQRIYKKYAADNARLMARFNNMMQQVVAWQPPTPQHDKFKEYLVEQLNSAIEFHTHDYDTILNQPKKSAREWLNYMISDCEQCIARAKERIVEGKKDTQDAVNWINELVKSVPIPGKK